MDGDAEDPFGEGIEEEKDDQSQETNPSEVEQDENGTLDNHSKRRNHNQSTNDSINSSSSQLKDIQSQTDLTNDATRLSIEENMTLPAIAQALVDDEYIEENPPVPYAVWRDSVEDARQKTTLNFNKDALDPLVEDAQRKFKEEHGSGISATDVRELAMAYGLVNADAIFEMAKEWGIQYETTR